MKNFYDQYSRLDLFRFINSISNINTITVWNDLLQNVSPIDSEEVWHGTNWIGPLHEAIQSGLDTNALATLMKGKYLSSNQIIELMRKDVKYIDIFNLRPLSRPKVFRKIISHAKRANSDAMDKYVDYIYRCIYHGTFTGVLSLESVNAITEFVGSDDLKIRGKLRAKLISEDYCTVSALQKVAAIETKNGVAS